jgi:flagellar biosynthetic protein FliQ
MNEAIVLDLTRQGLIVVLLVSLPILAIALFVGLIIAVFQAITQVQEMTLTYVPKLLCAALMVVMFGGWMMTTLVAFMRVCFNYAAKVTT